MFRSATPIKSAIVLATLTVAIPLFSPHLRAKKSPAPHAVNEIPCHPERSEGSAFSSSSTTTQLQSSIPALMQQTRVPGLSLALIQHGKPTRLLTFGLKNATAPDPVTPATTFEAASLSKPVFAYSVLKLVDQGKLALDTPLITYLPKQDLAALHIPDDPRLSQITARLVLSHRSGLPNWPGDDNQLHIYFTPGERFSYSGAGYIALQRVVEHITGKPLNDYITESVFTPLHMTSSSYVWRPDFDALTATGHDENAAPQKKWKPDEAGAASTLNTTARDYALFVAAILNHQGLKPATLRAMETPQIALDPTCRICIKQTPAQDSANSSAKNPPHLSTTLFWGLGWGIQRTNNRNYLWHWGDNGSFKAFVMLDPKSKSAIILFANSSNGLALAEPLVTQSMHTTPDAFTWLK